MSTAAAAARPIRPCVRSWIAVDARRQLRLGKRWHTWHERLTMSSGLRTQWSLHLHRALAHVGHVAVGAGHAAPRVHALAPHLELRVLGLETSAPVSACAQS